MSDLSATNCGCENNCEGFFNGCGNNSCLWIILLLIFCGGNGYGFNDRCGGDCNGRFGNNSCLWIILILIFCSGNGCGC
ncbi:MAG: chorion class high-cysteine HCB protein 13 [Schaedlerella sp.]|nr:chorion class high-cysteine HCB protein 13 [Lachnospiraceae bacterium]MDY4202781.1 chorion class high-cysteine HCB protein 13 [Schaedlerella sp.]